MDRTSCEKSGLCATGPQAPAMIVTAAFALAMITAASVPAQTLTTLHSFAGQDGSEPQAALLQAIDGNLYGTTASGGANTNSNCSDGCGTVFRIAPGGRFERIYSFCSQTGCVDGSSPFAGLVQGTDGNLYGTTEAGGANNDGTIFRITTAGTLTTLYSFNGTDGEYPFAGVTEGRDGNFYGTTYAGGTGGGCPDVGCGTVFMITTEGTLTTLHNFNGSDGAFPYAPPAQGTDGNFYGTTSQGGGTNSYGTIYKMTPEGALTTLFAFCSSTGCPDGDTPIAGLVEASNGNFYGTTIGGNLDDNVGGVFAITPGGSISTIYTFCSEPDCADGDFPYAGLIQGTDGYLYGSTENGGNPFQYGTLFRITPHGKLTTLYLFCSRAGCIDGIEPLAALVQHTNGKFYGTTLLGGDHNLGTIFSLSVGLGPFVIMEPTSGKSGKPINILGTDLTGATSVTFNGTAGSFMVESGSLIRATVPVGATTGTVKVVTPGGTLSSSVPFHVVQ